MKKIIFLIFLMVMASSVLAEDVCDTNADCMDDNLCNIDYCLNEVCRYSPLPNPTDPSCCLENIDCDDNNVNTVDTCGTESIQQCSNEVKDENTQQSCGHHGDCEENSVCKDIDSITSKGTCEFGVSCSDHSDCNDENEDTVDYCINTICYNLLTCTEDLDCEDSNDDTVDVCESGFCKNVEVECTTNTDCDDELFCTTDVCENNLCTNEETPECCEFDVSCNDNNLCTVDSCDLEVNQCIFETTVGCCNTNDECEDNFSCTEDKCINYQCHSSFFDDNIITTFGEDSLCCNEASDCTSEQFCSSSGECQTGCGSLTGDCLSGQHCNLETNACETGCAYDNDCFEVTDNEKNFNQFCVESSCVNCKSNTDCDDEDTCTSDLCVEGTCQNNYKDDCAICNNDEDCKFNNLDGQCIAGFCRFFDLDGEGILTPIEEEQVQNVLNEIKTALESYKNSDDKNVLVTVIEITNILREFFGLGGVQ
jgi:hypothetical protein